jgi:hypothetical protein
MSDLDKLMTKLKKKEEPKAEPSQDLDDQEDEEDEEYQEDEEDFDNEDEDEESEEGEEEAEESKPIPKPKPVKPQKHDPVDPIPANVDDHHSIESEVALLQNNGVFRRELLLTLKELVDVHKVNTQTLIDLRKKFDEADGTEKSK